MMAMVNYHLNRVDRVRSVGRARGMRLTASVDAPNPASSITYAVGDRVWASVGDLAQTTEIALCEITRVGRARVVRGPGVYDEDDAPAGAGMEGMSGVAGGEVVTHQRDYTVRVLHTERAPEYDGRGQTRIYPATDVELCGA
jgi:hypothetical protein